MKFSKLFLRTLREEPKDEVSINSRLLIRAGFIDKLMAGVYTFLPLGFRVLKKIEQIIRKEMIKAGGQELLMPVLQPKENWLKTGRWETYDTLFRFVSYHSQNEFVLGPTHEEIISPLVAKLSLSYKDLPLYLFQIQTKFRDEKRIKSGILRSREFIMKDLYSFHESEEDMIDYYEKMKGHYKAIFNKTGIGEKTYITFASGGSFSRYSHEFQTVTAAGEDTIFLCPKCLVAINKELVGAQGGKPECPSCKSNDLEEKKAIEVGNIFPLKTKYSGSFNLTFMNRLGKRQEVVMGCYGIGLGRLMGAIVEVNHDDKGIIWPPSVAPYSVHLICLGKEPEIKNTADGIYQLLNKEGLDLLYDDRTEASAGEKFADADLIGIPLRIVVSRETIKTKSVEVKNRESGEVKLFSGEDLVKFLTSFMTVNT
jgi:prolyl-tRNA synthetase